MRHAVFVRPDKVEWRETPDAKIESAKEAVVRPLVVGRCDLDAAYTQGIFPLPSGAPIGHEIIGEIVDLGEDAVGLQIGQRVFVPAQISCGTCHACRTGRTGRCASVPFGASYGMGREGDFGGGLADLVRVPFAQAMLTPLPAGADPVALIGAADMGADAWRTVGPWREQLPGAKALVLGGQPPVIGIYAAALAKTFGAAEVAYVDVDSYRRDVAASYGATCHAEVEELGEARFDFITVANPTKAALAAAFAHVAAGGRITSVVPSMDGMPELNPAELYHHGVHWHTGRPDCRHCHDGVVDSWANLGFDPSRVPTQKVEWEAAPEAWSEATLYVAAVRN